MARVFTLGDLRTRCQQRCDLENSGLISDAEWLGLLSTAYGEFYSLLVSAGARYFEREYTITTIAATNATGTITHVTKANTVDGETFSLNDGYGEITFEFDVAGTGVSAGNVQVDVSGDTTAEDIETTTISAINGASHEDGRAIAITAASGGSGITALTHDETGEIGNQVCSESVANASFLVTDMTGGGQTYRLPTDHLATGQVHYLVDTTSGRRWALREMMAQEMHRYVGWGSTSQAVAYSIRDQFIRLVPFPPAGQTYKLVYIPQNPDLTGKTTSYKVDCVTPDGEEFIVSHVQVNALSKEDSDIRGAVAARERMRERIVEWATLRSFYGGKSHMVDDRLSMLGEDGDFYRGRW